MTLVDFDSIKKTFVFTCMVHVQDSFMESNYSNNIVNTKHYTMLDLRFLEFDQKLQSKI